MNFILVISVINMSDLYGSIFF